MDKAEMLISLTVVDSHHFIRYKCKITHCLDSQTSFEYISLIAPDDNEKLSCNEVPEVLIGVGILPVQINRYTKSSICYNE